MDLPAVLENRRRDTPAPARSTQVHGRGLRALLSYRAEFIEIVGRNPRRPQAWLLLSRLERFKRPSYGVRLPRSGGGVLSPRGHCRTLQLYQLRGRPYRRLCPWDLQLRQVSVGRLHGLVSNAGSRKSRKIHTWQVWWGSDRSILNNHLSANRRDIAQLDWLGDLDF